LIAGITLGLLALMKKRSAAERSWVAHIGLLALVIMAFAPLVLPNWNVETPALLSQAPTSETRLQTAPPMPSTATLAPASKVAPAEVPSPTVVSLSPAAAATAVYAVPAAVLLFI